VEMLDGGGRRGLFMVNLLSSTLSFQITRKERTVGSHYLPIQDEGAQKDLYLAYFIVELSTHGIGKWRRRGLL
jgi:hypothetical protein